MANTVNKGTDCIEISTIDSDYDMGIRRQIASIEFVPGAADDILVIKDGADDGPIRYYDKSGDGEPRIKYFLGTFCQVYLDFSDCTFNAGMRVIIDLF